MPSVADQRVLLVIAAVVLMMLYVVPKLRQWYYVSRLPLQDKRDFLTAFDNEFQVETLIEARKILGRITSIPPDKLRSDMEVLEINKLQGGGLRGMEFSDFLEDLLEGQGHDPYQYDPSHLTVHELITFMLQSKVTK